MNRCNNHFGFTLIEVALSLAVLVIGLTAVLSVYMVSLNWAEDIRIDLTALQTGRAVLADAGILMDKDHNPMGLTNRDQEAKGWINDYFVVRGYDPAESVELPRDAGTIIKVRIKVYYGGNDVDGVVAHSVMSHQILLKEYQP